MRAQEEKKKSPYLVFAQGVLAGDYKEHQVFLGMVEAMVTNVERSKQGKGMRNMSYDTSYDQLMHTISVMSPRVHRLLSQHFQIRTLKNIRSVHLWWRWKCTTNCIIQCKRIKKTEISSYLRRQMLFACEGATRQAGLLGSTMSIERWSKTVINMACLLRYR